MPSPFPGMDPYIEGQVWPGFHNLLIAEIVEALVPQVRPRYVVMVEEFVYLSTVEPQAEKQSQPLVVRPDVAIEEVSGTTKARVRRTSLAIAQPAEVILPIPEEHRDLYVEIRLRESRELVTVVEVLSPANKTGSGRKEYLRKRERTLCSAAHLIEIDLLREGTRMPMTGDVEFADFMVLVSRAPARPRAAVWTFGLRDPLPSIPVPLAGDDDDAALDLQAAFTTVYDRAGYDYAVDYSRKTAPALSPQDAAWAERLLHPLSDGDLTKRDSWSED